MVSNFIKNNLSIFFGNIIFRIGGYIYKFLMIFLLDSAAYGILTVISPFQNILQIFAAGGLPPTISKYVAEYNAKKDYEKTYKIIFIALKLMFILGLLFALLMIFFIAPFLVKIYHNPDLLIPLQIVGLIVPFSAIVGAFRGIFQGMYKMEYILLSRGIEQIVMIFSAVILVILGFSVAGSVFGSVLGFFGSLISVLVIFNKFFSDTLNGILNLNIDFKEELSIIFRLISFSIPVILTAISEIGVFSVCTIIMPLFISVTQIGYFGVAEPIARLPLMLSNSLATTMLPVSSEMFAVNNDKAFQKYVFNSMRYNLLITLPICILLIIFSKEILLVLFFTKVFYAKGAMVLSILTAGMLFYSFFSISSSIIQGIGNPRIPMYLLIFSFIQLLILSFILIPIYGVNGGAIATMISTASITVISFLILIRLVDLNLNLSYYLKILCSGLFLSIFLIIVHNIEFGFLLGVIFFIPLYVCSLILLKGFTNYDMAILGKILKKFKVNGLIYKFFINIISFIERGVK